MKAMCAPARAGRRDALRRVVDRVTVDVHHAVEVEHQQVVGRRQALAPGPATVQLLARCPYDAPMESGRPTVPPYVAGPLQLSPFRALSLAPRRVGDPASARAFARPYRGVPQRLETW